jgi:hypothetical protein
MNVLIHAGELDRIAGWAQAYPQLETGGEFFGFYTRSGAPIVQLVLGAAPDSIHNSTSFYQGKDFLHGAAKLLLEHYGLQHLGSWHSHHQMGLAQPSSGDESTVRNALAVHELPSFLLGIANLHRQRCSSQSFDVNLGGFIFQQGQKSYGECSWVVLPGDSPIRTSLQPLNSEFFIDPQLSIDWQVKRSSLTSPVVVSTTPVQISDRVWYSNPEGLDLLKSIYEQFTTGFDECVMNRTDDERIYFTFDRVASALPNRDGKTWRLELPDDFPRSPCPLYQTQSPDLIGCLEVENGADLFATVREFITNRSEVSEPYVYMD